MHVVWSSNTTMDDYLEEWAASRIPHVGTGEEFDGEKRFAAVVDDAGTLKAVMIFHDYQPQARTIQGSTASVSPYWAKHNVIKELLHYVFVTCDCNKFWTATPHTSLGVLRFNKSLGMKQEAILRHHFGDRMHCVVNSMMRTEYLHSKWAVPACTL